MNNGLNPDQITQVLIAVLIIMTLVVIALAVVYLVIKLNNKKEKSVFSNSENEIKTNKKIAKEYTKESIYKFLEFDKIEDNMIVQKNGKRYLMVVECQGINYDLMSQSEKIGVEEGFIQFLNTLRHPIQIYVQTRTINLNESIENYQKRVEEIKIKLENKKMAYLKNVKSGEYTQEELSKQFYEVTKQSNLYEYGKDIIANTEKMSLNKNVLNKKYYIIISYYPEETTDSTFDKEEIRSLAFSELYTKAQSIIRTISTSGVVGKIMSSNELVDLLYVAYNRDEAEVFSVNRALRAGYEELYTTAQDVVERKMQALNEEIERKAVELANQKVIEVRTAREKKIEEMRKNIDELVEGTAEIMLEESSQYIGNKTVEQAIQLIKQEKEKRENKKNMKVEEKEEPPKKKTTRKTKVTKQGGNEDAKEEKERAKKLRTRKATK